jgi:hypothetical protein
VRHTHRRARSIGLISFATFIVLGVATAASAHEGRNQGDLSMEVGFGTEPALAGEPNSAQIILVHDGRPVVDLGDTLSIEVSFGDTSVELPLEANFEVGEFGEPGDYRAWFIPTQPGRYTFHFTGTVDGEDVDQSFTSGPRTFSEVEDPSSIMFPAVHAPSTGELADRIDRESARVSEDIRAAEERASVAKDNASRAGKIGFFALLVGAIGVAAAIGAFAVGRRAR